MAVYLVGFLISLFLFYYADSKRFHGLDVKISVFLALLIPCLIAGFRYRDIGTDVRVYAEPMFEWAQEASNFSAFWNGVILKADSLTYNKVSEFEVGFVVLCYFSAKVLRSMPVMLFAIQALTVIPIYKGLRAYSHRIPVWLGMCVYYLLYFNQSLNVMRQWIAMAFLFYGFQFLPNRQYRKYFLSIAAAMLFHYSSIVGVAIFCVYQLVAREHSYNRKVKAVLLILIGVVTILSMDLIASLMTLMGLRYGNYFAGALTLMPNQFLYRIPFLILLAWRWRHLKRTTPYADFFLVMVAYDLLASQLTSIFPQSARIALFFGEYSLLAYPMVCMASDSKKNRQAMKVFTVIYLCIYWSYTYAIMNSGNTVPYVSILGG